MSRTFQINGDIVQVTGVSLNPNLSPDQDPLAGFEIEKKADVNIFLTHYPIEGFDGYFGQEVHIRKSSIPRRFQLFASGHLHHQQKKTVNETPIYYPGSTERTSFNEEFEKKGFYSLELDRTGVIHEEFHPTPARRMETLDCQVLGQASLTRQVQEALEKTQDTEKILRVRVTGRVTLDQLSTYKRASLLAYSQDKFFHVDFDEDGLNVLTMIPLESLPKTTPLEEIDRTFQTLLEKATEQERPIVQDAWKLVLAKLQEEGVS
jgi:DNA repair exonuclease SbcCD nuclease subunit